MDEVQSHYGEDASLARTIAARLEAAGKDMAHLTVKDLRAVDEFHIRGHAATLEVASRLNFTPSAHVLDIGSGLGGPARALAQLHGCTVTGVDLTQSYCDAATEMSRWVGLEDLVSFRQGDATRLPFADASFDAALTIHVAMNIAAKDRMYAEARRVLKPGGRFVIYDVVQGEGGEVLYPVPWAREATISHLVTTEEMQALLAMAGFTILEMQDSTQESADWFSRIAGQSEPARVPADRTGDSGTPPSLREVLGEDFPTMMRNQVRNLKERRIRTVMWVCVA